MNPAPGKTTTRTIATNSFWFGFETLVSIVLLFATSIPLARIIGPEKLGYFNYVAWLTTMSASIGGLGIPSMSGKFIAEYLGRGEQGTVRAIFFNGLRLQIVLATLITLASVAVVLIWGDARYQLVSSLQVLSVLPAMLLGMPSMTNVAAENMRANFAGSMVSSATYLVGVLLSLWLGWGLVGVASSFALARCADLVLKMAPCIGWMRKLPRGSISPDLRQRMGAYTRQQLALMVLGLVVWDRSDVVLLKMLTPDIRQVTFFTVAYNLSEKLLLAPRVFGAAIGASLVAQYGRDSEKMNEMAAVATRYMILMGAPLLIGMALISPALIRVLYGSQYIAAIPVLAVGSAFAVFKAVVDPPDAILRAHNRQRPVVVTSLIAAAANIGVDWLLIPGHGALGAAVGNGIAQTLHVLFTWAICLVLFPVRLDYKAMGKIGLACAAMAPPAMLCNSLLAPRLALPAAVLAGAIVFPLVLRLTSFFEAKDRQRFEHLMTAVPSGLRPAWNAAFNLLIPVAEDEPALP